MGWVARLRRKCGARDRHVHPTDTRARNERFAAVAGDARNAGEESSDQRHRTPRECGRSGRHARSARTGTPVAGRARGSSGSRRAGSRGSARWSLTPEKRSGLVSAPCSSLRGNVAGSLADGLTSPNSSEAIASPFSWPGCQASRIAATRLRHGVSVGPPVLRTMRLGTVAPATVEPPRARRSDRSSANRHAGRS